MKVFCNFIGHPRSGHSVVSSILDAHEAAVFSHRLDALGHLSAGVAPEAVFHMIARNAERFARSGRNDRSIRSPASTRAAAAGRP
ncbi:hypothetical protein ACRAWD_26835 [Caulobacter segnis]